VTADYFKVLGIAPAFGRLFDRTDFLGGSASTVVISRALWQRLFNSDPTAIGRNILVNAARRQIVGVADVPASVPGASNLWLPCPEDAPLLRNRRAHLYTVVARVSPKVSIAAANAELEAIAVGLRPLGGDASDVSFRATGLADRIVQPVRPALLVLWASVLLLLTIGFANVANLLLVQGSVRARELSIRTALGAGRARLMQQLVIESLVLGAVGGALGSALGIWSVSVVRRFLPPSLPRVTDVTADPMLAAFGIGLSIACAVAFGLLPALRASIRDPMDALRSRDMEARPSRARDVLVAAEVALTLILLVGAGLLGRSLLSVSRVLLGFDPRSLVTIDLSLPSGKYNDAAAHRQFYERALDRIRQLPEVSSAGVTGALPLTPTAATGMRPEDGIPDAAPVADVITATPGLFAALRIPLSRGRLFDERDRAGAAPVAIVNESAARQFWPAGTNPIGRAITMEDWGDPYPATVIGIVRDVHQGGPDQQVSPALYYPLAQFPETTLVQTIVVRGDGLTDRIIAAVRDIVHDIDRDQPIALATTMEERLSAATASRRVNLMLLAAFAAAAVLMAGVGIYGVVAFAIASRTREIGVRMALGATSRHIARFAALRGAGPVVAGAALGVIGALFSARVLQDLIYGVAPRDPATLSGAVIVVLVVALLAVAGPTRRAVRVDPLVALRSE
jgi:putative ABC transport system permease protein